MAEDDGTGRPGLPARSTTSGGGSADLNVDASELIKFKNRVDGLLTKLDASPAAPTRVEGGQVARGDLGTGFAEADELYAVHKRVHTELQNLSQGLAGQIEALGIAVDGSRKGYENIDDDIRRRMQRISRSAREEYDRRQEERRKEQEPATDGQPAAGQGGTDAGSEF
ncbi:hypothetical protein [Streptomyces lushanensis]|uniref:hypothetical protein n=1 Tax=Streptomyces lushanensis TaxID=1434255 RepID=UPI00114D2578|nr:hypothetical protein [Streptomyces lushanensis]